MIWGENKQSTGFAEQWKVKDVQIIIFEGRNVGWVQAAEMASEIFLQQLFVSPDYQGRGIGSKVLEILLKRWERMGKASRSHRSQEQSGATPLRKAWLHCC